MNFGFLKKIVTFGGDEVGGHSAPTKLDYGDKGGYAEKWIKMPDAQAMVDAAMKQKGFLGTAKYSSRDQAEAAVAAQLWAAKTAIMKEA